MLFGTISAAVTNIMVNLLCIPFIRQDGAALAVVVAEFVVFLINGRQCRKLVKLERLGNVILSSFVASIAMGTFCIIVEKYIAIFVFKLCLKVVGGVLIYAMVLLMTKNEVALEYVDIVKNKIKR